MKNKHFDSYAERVRAAKVAAKDAAKKVEKPKKKFKTSQIITFVLMVIWSICSVFGVFGFARTFERKNNGMRVIGASAAPIDNNSNPNYFEKDGNYVVPLAGFQGFAIKNTATNVFTSMTPFYIFYNLSASNFYLRFYNASQFVVGSYGALSTGQSNLQSMSIPFVSSGSTTTTITTRPFSGYSYIESDTENIPVTALPTKVTYSAVLSNTYPQFRFFVEFQEKDENNVITYYYHTIVIQSTNIASPVGLYMPFFGLNVLYNDLPSDLTLTDNTTYYHAVDSLTYAEFYQAFDEGFKQGLEDWETAVNNAYNNGYNAGKTAGMNENLEGIYTFDNLLSAVIDVPIKGFQSLLNFEILGVNLLAFAESLIFIGLLLFLVKLLI